MALIQLMSFIASSIFLGSIRDRKAVNWHYSWVVLLVCIVLVRSPMIRSFVWSFTYLMLLCTSLLSPCCLRASGCGSISSVSLDEDSSAIGRALADDSSFFSSSKGSSVYGFSCSIGSASSRIKGEMHSSSCSWFIISSKTTWMNFSTFSSTCWIVYMLCWWTSNLIIFLHFL